VTTCVKKLSGYPLIFLQRRFVVSLLVMLFLNVNPAQALEPMDDTEMGTVTGKEGVLISLQYYYNSRPPHDVANDEDIGSANADCTGLASVNCRLALQLENRDFGWLVFKNGHASLEMNRLSLDAAFLGGDPEAENGVSAANKLIDLNDEKFRNESGDCLFGDCTKSWIDNSPAVRAQYPESGGIYTAGNAGQPGTSQGYNDVLLGVYVQGLAVEYNEPEIGETWAAAPGWQANNFGSFLGFEIADNNSHQAGIAIGGNFYMYGF
jgi:hypothetical protein|tara:strand:+ start:1867 stop:2661 length:795 start_codon:yes stop_codon:yes gene_type:complete